MCRKIYEINAYTQVHVHELCAKQPRQRLYDIKVHIPFASDSMSKLSDDVISFSSVEAARSLVAIPTDSLARSPTLLRTKAAASNDTHLSEDEGGDVERHAPV